MLKMLKSLFSKPSGELSSPDNYDQALVIFRQKYSYHIATEVMLSYVHEQDKILFTNTLALTSYNLATQIGNAVNELMDFPELQAQAVQVMVDVEDEIKSAIVPVGNLVAIEQLDASYERLKRVEALEISWFK